MSENPSNEQADKTVADEIHTSLDVIRQGLLDIAFHDQPLDEEARYELEGGLSEAINYALAERMRRRSQALASDPLTRSVTVAEIVARTVKRLRENANLTQEQLAQMMQRLGFTNWKRLTVTEIETGKRRLSHEEMIGMTILFNVPVAYLLASFNPGEVLELNERVILTSAQAQELLTGTPLERAWYGIWVLPSMPSANVFDGQSFLDDWRPASDSANYADTIEGEHGQLILRFPGFM